MSDPMTNTDVEDVLASIRRLVSDNARPGSATVQQPPSDRLVLTPSLRVPEEDDADETGVEDESASEDEAVTDDAQDADDDDLSTFVETAFRTNRSTPDRINVRQHGFVPADESAVVAKLSASLPSADKSSVASPSEQAVPTDPMVLSNDEDGLEDSVTPDQEGATLSEDEAEAGLVPEDWASEVDEPVTADGTPEDEQLDAPIEPWATNAADEAEFGDEAHAQAATDIEQGDLSDGPAEPVAQSLSEKIAALETLVGERRDQFEPDDPGTDAYAGTEPPAMEWEDVEPEEDPVEEPEANLIEEPEVGLADAPEAQTVEDVADAAEAAPAGFASTDAAAMEDGEEIEAKVAPQKADPTDEDLERTAAVLFGSDDDVLDEDALRELISDIVREELQGALGERITRNVRKLVRREIHRALAAQDLE